MWIFILLIIAVIIIIFLYQRQNMLGEMDSNGGILVKYNTLIQYILSMPNSEITNKGRDHVNLICKGNGVNTYFTITPAFDVVIIQWELKGGPMFNFKETWNFAEDKLTQQDMIKQMEKDINMKMETIFPKAQVEAKSELNRDSTQQTIVAPPSSEQAILESIIIKPFLALDIAEQATVLSVFLQYEHDNPFIEKYRNDFIVLNNYYSYDAGFSHFKKIIAHDKKRLDEIILLFESIQSNLELFRLGAIISFVKGNVDEGEEILALTTALWKKLNYKPSLYAHLLMKTKADLLFFAKEYQETAKILTEGYKLLFSGILFLKNSSMLKYQYAQALIQVAEYTAIDFRKKELKVSCDQYLVDADIERHIQDMENHR